MGRRSFSSVDNVLIKIGPKSQRLLSACRCYLWWKYIHFAARQQSIIIIIILSVSTDCVWAGLTLVWPEWVWEEYVNVDGEKKNTTINSAFPCTLMPPWTVKYTMLSLLGVYLGNSIQSTAQRCSRCDGLLEQERDRLLCNTQCQLLPQGQRNAAFHCTGIHWHWNTPELLWTCCYYRSCRADYELKGAQWV